MFLSAKPIIKTNQGYGGVAATKLGDFNIDISITFNVIDTDFEETVDTWTAVDAVIIAYEQRNLDVVKALVRLFIKDPYVQYSAREQRSHPLYGEKYSKYADDVERYMMLV